MVTRRELSILALAVRGLTITARWTFSTRGSFCGGLAFDFLSGIVEDLTNMVGSAIGFAPGATGDDTLAEGAHLAILAALVFPVRARGCSSMVEL